MEIQRIYGKSTADFHLYDELIKDNEEYNGLLEEMNDFTKHDEIRDSNESGEIDNSINMNDTKWLVAFNDSNKEKDKIDNNQMGEEPSNFVLANAINWGEYPLKQSNYI